MAGSGEGKTALQHEAVKNSLFRKKRSQKSEYFKKIEKISRFLKYSRRKDRKKEKEKEKFFFFFSDFFSMFRDIFFQN
jgi:hypothetical protein